MMAAERLSAIAADLTTVQAEAIHALDYAASGPDHVHRPEQTAEQAAWQDVVDAEHIAERIAETAARIAGGEYRPSYNGWTNRETWNASLWINNDHGTYEAAREIIRAAMDGSDYETRGIVDAAEDRRYQVRTAGDALREWWDELNAPDGASPLSDAWSYAVAVVDWYAVAEGLAEDMPAAGSGYLP